MDELLHLNNLEVLDISLAESLWHESDSTDRE